MRKKDLVVLRFKEEGIRETELVSFSRAGDISLRVNWKRGVWFDNVYHEVPIGQSRLPGYKREEFLCTDESSRNIGVYSRTRIAHLDRMRADITRVANGEISF